MCCFPAPSSIPPLPHSAKGKLLSSCLQRHESEIQRSQVHWLDDLRHLACEAGTDSWPSLSSLASQATLMFKDLKKPNNPFIHFKSPARSSKGCLFSLCTKTPLPSGLQSVHQTHAENSINKVHTWKLLETQCEFTNYSWQVSTASHVPVTMSWALSTANEQLSYDLFFPPVSFRFSLLSYWTLFLYS
jgi:hypothetical protein